MSQIDTQPVSSAADQAESPSVPNRPPDARIRPVRGWQPLNLTELWKFRHLLWLFALRDVTVRYKQTALGFAWAILQPAAQVIIFTLFFGKLMGLEDRVGDYNGKAVPYAVFVMTGQLLWNLFNAIAGASANSMLANAHILRKIYIPKLIVPLATSGAPTADCLISMGLLAGVMIYYGQAFSWMLLLTPLMLLATILAAQSFGVLLSAIIVTYRDFRFVVPFTLQTWFFLTPVIYPVNILPEGFENLIYLNPMAGVIETFRAMVLNGPVNTTGLAISLGVTAVVFTAALYYFARVERRFADIA